MAAALFPTSCQYIGSQVAFSQNQYNWFFFSEGFPIHARRGECPAQCCTAGWFARRAPRDSSGGMGLALPPSPRSQVPPRSGTNTHPARIPSILTTRPCLPKNTKHSLPCPGSSLHRNLNPTPLWSPGSFAHSPFPSQLSPLKAVSAHSRHGLCLPQPVLHTQLQQKNHPSKPHAAPYLQNRYPSQTLQATLNKNATTCLAMTSA